MVPKGVSRIVPLVYSKDSPGGIVGFADYTGTINCLLGSFSIGNQPMAIDETLHCVASVHYRNCVGEYVPQIGWVRFVPQEVRLNTNVDVVGSSHVSWHVSRSGRV